MAGASSILYYVGLRVSFDPKGAKMNIKNDPHIAANFVQRWNQGMNPTDLGKDEQKKLCIEYSSINFDMVQLI